MAATPFEFTQSGIRSPAARARSALWTGRVLTSIAVLFLAFDIAIKLTLSSPAVDATSQLGFASRMVLPLGLIELACLTLYLIPRTSIIGAILFTGYLGGAIATHVRLENPLFSHILFPLYIAALLWAGLWLRDPRVRTMYSSTRT